MRTCGCSRILALLLGLALVPLVQAQDNPAASPSPAAPAVDAQPAPAPAPAEQAQAVAEEEDIHAIRGNPPADSAFAKLTLGMKPEEVLQVLGKPDAERGYCTGKHRIPFYYGRDRAYVEYFYKGQGKLYFYADFSTFKMFHGAIHSCSAKAPLELAGVAYNTQESGVAPKEE